MFPFFYELYLTHNQFKKNSYYNQPLIVAQKSIIGMLVGFPESGKQYKKSENQNQLKNLKI